MTLLSMVPITLTMHFLILLVREMSQTELNLLLILAWVELPKFLISINAIGYLMASWQAWHGDFGDLGCW